MIKSTQFLSLVLVIIRFNSVLFVRRLFTLQLSLGALQSQTPEPEAPGRHRKKPRAGPCSQGGTLLLRVGRVQDEKERESIINMKAMAARQVLATASPRSTEGRGRETWRDTERERRRGDAPTERKRERARCSILAEAGGPYGPDGVRDRRVRTRPPCSACTCAITINILWVLGHDAADHLIWILVSWLKALRR